MIAHFVTEDAGRSDILLGLSGAYPHYRLTINEHVMEAKMEDLDP